MITFNFNEKKTTQAASLLLKKNGGEMDYTKLIKLLYLIDRNALIHWERPVTGDLYFSMERGPVLSKVLDIINYGEFPGVNSYWHKYISTPKDYNIKVKEEFSEYDELNKKEIELINELSEKFKDFSQWDMVNICHEILPEWVDPGKTSKPIDVESILKEGHKTEEDIKRIEEEVDSINYVKKVLSIKD